MELTGLIEKKPGDTFRRDLHHARMTLLPIIAEGGNSWYTAMQAIKALSHIEHMVKGLVREAEYLDPNRQCEAKGESDGG